MWSLDRVLVRRRAAEFWTYCSFLEDRGGDGGVQEAIEVVESGGDEGMEECFSGSVCVCVCVCVSMGWRGSM